MNIPIRNNLKWIRQYFYCLANSENELYVCTINYGFVYHLHNFYPLIRILWKIDLIVNRILNLNHKEWMLILPTRIIITLFLLLAVIFFMFFRCKSEKRRLLPIANSFFLNWEIEKFKAHVFKSKFYWSLNSNIHCEIWLQIIIQWKNIGYTEWQLYCF